LRKLRRANFLSFIVVLRGRNREKENRIRKKEKSVSAKTRALTFP
jgi:hypothetical protein